MRTKSRIRAIGVATLAPLVACGAPPAPARESAPIASASAAASSSNDTGISLDSGSSAGPSRARERKLAAGWRHTCAVGGNDELRCWGLANGGQLGDGTMQNREAPSRVAGIAHVRSLALGHTHSCAVTSEGALYCWGGDSFGELADGTTGYSPTPKRSPMFDHVVETALGDQHTCVLVEDGSVTCLGLNDYGQAGGAKTGATAPEQRSPATRIPLGDVVEIAAGDRFTCARTKDGAVSCWGANLNGQLGDGTKTARTTPVRVQGIDRAVQLVANAQSACARLDDGAVTCWGSAIAQPGEDRVVPAPLAAGDRFVDFTLGDRIWCGKKADGEVRCAGQNISSSAAVAFSDKPVAIAAWRNASELAAGGGHVCARVPSGDISCFGRNIDGQVGDGSYARREPRDVPGVAQVNAIASASTRTCVASGASLSCFGGYEIAADGTSSPIHAPHPLRVWPSSTPPIAKLSLADGVTCARFTDGRVTCLAEPSSKALGREARTTTAIDLVASGARDVAVGSDHVCVVNQGKSVLCVGDSSLGAIGKRKKGLVSSLEIIPLAASTSRVAASGSRTCAILDGGEAWCWGGGLASGGLDAIAFAQPEPRSVKGTRGATAIALGYSGGCVVLAGGALACWTDPSPDAMTLARSAPVPGALPPAVAQPVAGISDAIDVSMNSGHTCVLTRTGGVSCFGDDEVGQLGDGASAKRATPALVPGVTNVVALSTGGRHTCAVTKSGTTKCWGLAIDGELGDGTSEVVAAPARVLWR